MSRSTTPGTAVRNVAVALAVAGGAAVAASGSYLAFGRRRCLTWGAAEEDVTRVMPGDELLDHPDLVSTRAVRIAASPADVWPWLMQMGSGKGGVYTYDWIENLLGLDMHSVDVVLPQFQNRKVGDIEALGTKGPRLRVEILEPQAALVLRSDDGNWVWAFGLYPDQVGTVLVSRNRIISPSASAPMRALTTLIMEPGSLIMERKMLLGIKQRAETLAGSRTSTVLP